MPTTPSQRTTRSNSNSASINLNDIKTLIENSKTELLNTFNVELTKLNNNISTILKRIDILENRCRNLEITADKARDNAEILKEEVLKEAEDRYARRKFLIVSGLTEPETGSPMEREAEDAKSLT